MEELLAVSDEDAIHVAIDALVVVADAHPWTIGNYGSGPRNPQSAAPYTYVTMRGRKKKRWEE